MRSTMGSRGALALLFGTCSLICAGRPASGQEVRFSLRPHYGVILPEDSDVQDIWSYYDQVGMGFKLTVGHLGIQASLDYVFASREETILGSDVDVDIWMVPMKLTFTYELNPPKRVDQGAGFNLYAGGGFGVYPVGAEVSVDSSPITFGISESDATYGFHLVLGGEILISSTVSLFTEVGWAHAGIPDDYDKNLVGLSVVGGLGIWF
ncbi:MAG: hypothetical protein JXP34_17765 [Planctomycetes bacterium]|nr:hypothetical protein [Planctomycetota bacterium]